MTRARGTHAASSLGGLVASWTRRAPPCTKGVVSSSSGLGADPVLSPSQSEAPLGWFRQLTGSPARAWAFLVLFTLVTRLPLLTYPKACDDEQVYNVVAIEMLNGGRPYIDAVERKPPLLFYLYDGI